MAERNVETEKVNVRLNTTLLAEVDESWREQGYNSRSEYIRQAIRDAVHESDSNGSTAALRRLLVSAEQARRGEFIEREEIREEFLDE